MLFFYLGLYTVIILIIWTFFIIARLHVLKFKNFSNDISPVTTLLGAFLVICSILGFILVFFIEDSSREYKEKKNTNIEKSKSLKDEIILEDY